MTDHSAMPERNSNHLSREKSPYLLQHADNPVDWYPWGPEAFEKAVREGKPVLLSIGYSTCHWCHVMAHESFENKDIAAFLNEHFVSIKVDREERPDIDSVYMNSVVAITGQGGWPLTVFLSPDQKPFFGGTYFPPSARWGQPGFMDLLRSIQDAWQNNRGQVIASGESLTELLQRSSDQQDQAPSLNSNTLDAAYHQLASGYDQTYGGFGSAPKFPMGHNLGFLLRYAKRSGRAQAGGMVEKTLQFMAQGGIYDHLAGGFHRYSTDPIWQVPHFEKMLYDQALLARAYLEGYQVFRDPAFADIAREVLDYVARDLKDPQGGFYSAEDADSLEPMEEGRGKSEEKKEGAFYIWSVGQLKEILSAEEFKVVEYYSDIHPEGNAQQDPHGEFVGKNIFYQARSLDETAGHLKMELQEVQALLRSAKSKLLQERNKRPRPHLDDKVLTDWNGLMIASFAYAANVLHEPKYARTACEAADFILNTLMDEQGTLLHRYRDGEAKFAATLEDYAFLVWGLLELYQATFDSKYLKKSAELADKMVKLFWDDEGKGFFMTAANAEQLIVRPKEIYDGAVPSGNSAALYDLVLLYHLTFEDKWQKRAEDILNAFAGSVAQRPSAYCFALWSLEYLNARSMEIILTGELSDNRLKELLQAVHGPYIPHKVIHVAHTYGMFKGFKALDDFVSSLKPDPHQPKAYVCENQTCRLPVADVQTLKKAIEG